jgi:hypothetical protein
MLNVITAAAYRVGRMLASPWAILLLALVSLSALPQTITATIGRGDITILVGWFSQNFVQLVALSVLAFIADQQGRAAEQRDQETHDKVERLFDYQEAHQKSLDSLHEKVDAAATDTTL